ncbi:ABC transporter ATP-binding protein [Rhodothermus profundi]|uniref:Carbohydrate ABC transporter ATP-binding protein, CUT1 family n=1 Tax=Rhodothermus profundi TaxID=633813 RepID=A0A1M6XAX3_9BACT|nr:sn-glycerol-3-phosphate ABC transporter ATP-binding protein UgpC [Rhodothermus profundi]SHL03104.1 carbohydrate ABC transporter ATP-binding protein, CUT1 family [Rhodothermus profundi]
MQQPAGVSLEQVWKIYDNGQVAVADVTFEAAEGEFLVLLGPSGCGKTTLLRLVAGLERVSRGLIRIGGQVVNEVPPRDRDIAMVFQNYALYPHMTVYENMAFGLKLRRVPKAEIDRRVRAAARVLELEHLLDRRPHQLSGGQRQRVAVGRAIVREPRVFLFDEPLSNLDARLRVEMRAELARLHRELGRTMLYVTHDQVEAMTLGQRIVVLNQGRIQQIGTPLEVYHRPANRFVAGFIGSPPMNFIEGRLEHRDGLWFVGEGGLVQVALPAAGWPYVRVGQAVTLGVRPEAVTIATPEQAMMQGTVATVEVLGAVANLHVRVGSLTVVAQVEATVRPEPEQLVSLRIDPARVHLFDAETGQALPRAA